MKAPDKIYVAVYPNDNGEGQHLGDWFLEPEYRAEDNLEYIKKDMLLEWAKEEKNKTSIGLSEYDAGHENARMELLNDLIDKINTL